MQLRLDDLASFALNAMKGHTVRTSLTVAGMAVGVAAVVVLTALGEGARGYVISEFASLGTNLVIVVPGKVETAGAFPFGGVTHNLTIDDAEALVRQVPGVLRGAPVALGTERVRFGSRSRRVPVIGVTAEYAKVRRLSMASGRFLRSGNWRRGTSELVLGQKLAKELFGSTNPLGRLVRVGPYRFRVVGVMAPKGKVFGFDFDDLALAHVSTVMRIFNRSSLFRVILEARSADDVGPVKRGVVEVIKRRHRADDVTVVTQDAVMSAFSDILRALTLAVSGIASISLVVAGVGIMNVMLIAVSERRPEVGLLKALGASTAQVLSVFLAESCVLAVVGGGIGLVSGWAFSVAMRRWLAGFPVEVTAWAVVAAGAVALAAGVGFGIYPAWKAARLDPVAALRSGR